MKYPFLKIIEKQIILEEDKYLELNIRKRILLILFETNNYIKNTNLALSDLILDIQSHKAKCRFRLDKGLKLYIKLVNNFIYDTIKNGRQVWIDSSLKWIKDHIEDDKNSIDGDLEWFNGIAIKLKKSLTKLIKLEHYLDVYRPRKNPNWALFIGAINKTKLELLKLVLTKDEEELLKTWRAVLRQNRVKENRKWRQLKSDEVNGRY